MQRTSNGPLLPEATIWSIIMQLTAGLKAIHHAGLACKYVTPRLLYSQSLIDHSS